MSSSDCYGDCGHGVGLLSVYPWHLGSCRQAPLLLKMAAGVFFSSWPWAAHPRRNDTRCGRLLKCQ